MFIPDFSFSSTYVFLKTPKFPFDINSPLVSLVKQSMLDVFKKFCKIIFRHFHQQCFLKIYLVLYFLCVSYDLENKKMHQKIGFEILILHTNISQKMSLCLAFLQRATPSILRDTMVQTNFEITFIYYAPA